MINMARNSGTSMFEKLTPIFIVVIVGMAFVVGMLWQKVDALERGGAVAVPTVAGNNNQPSVPEAPTNGKLSEDQASKITPVSADDHVRGNRDASVFIIEYSDLECPFCASFHPTALQAVDDYGGDVAWVYRHFPLDTIHPRARAAAVGSECAAELGGNDGFWAFSDYIFENQTTALTDLAGVAGSVGLDVGAFQTCVDSGEHEDRVESDYQDGLAAGVTGTPGNFIVNSNGETWVLPGAVPFATLQGTIDEALGG